MFLPLMAFVPPTDFHETLHAHYVTRGHLSMRVLIFWHEQYQHGGHENFLDEGDTSAT
jgi:hypothetical protein